VIPQVTVVPVSVVGVAGIFATVNVLKALVQYVEFARTPIFPVVKRLVLIATVMELVVDVPVIPVGRVHV
jgi:hypothetical protein